VIVLDTSVAVAFMNRRDDYHERAAGWMESVGEDLFTTPLIVAEIDHPVSRGCRPMHNLWHVGWLKLITLSTSFPSGEPFLVLSWFA